MLLIIPGCLVLLYHCDQTDTLKSSVSTHTFTSTQKVQERACRTAIGAVLSIGICLVGVCYNTFTRHIYIPWRSHLLSIQSLAGTILSLHPLYIWGPVLYCIQLPLCRLSSSTTCLWRHKVLGLGVSQSAVQLTSCLHGCASLRRRCTLPRRKLWWTWSSSAAEDTVHVPSIPTVLAGGVYSWKWTQKRVNSNKANFFQLKSHF